MPRTLFINIIILLTFLVALTLSVYPLSLALRWWRPEFVLMVMIYWIFAQPLRVSLISLCAIGLFQDVLEGAPFGQHSLGLVIVSYLCLLSYLRVRNYSLWQQSLWIFAMVAVAQVINTWVDALSGRPVGGFEIFFPAFASACFWPLCYLLLERVRRRYQITN